MHRTLIKVGSIGFLAISAASLGSCATTGDGSSGQDSTVADQGMTESGEEFTCRRIQITGTRRFQRICTSDAQWEEQQRRTEEAVDAIRAGDRGPVRPDQFEGPSD